MEVKVKALQGETELPAEDIRLQIFDGDRLVAETDVISMVKKAIIVASQNAQLAAALDALTSDTIEDKPEPGQIIMPGDS